jgi:hypothetical protein
MLLVTIHTILCYTVLCYPIYPTILYHTMLYCIYHMTRHCMLRSSSSCDPLALPSRRSIIAAYLPYMTTLPFAVLCYATLSVQCSRRAQAEVFSLSLFISISVSILVFFPSHFHSLTSSPVQSSRMTCSGVEWSRVNWRLLDNSFSL